MSYILDALRKSEQQRQRGATPSLLAAQATEAAPRRAPTLLYGLAAAAILVVGVAIGLLRPWQAEAPAVPPLEVKPPETVVSSAPPAPPSVEITINTERHTSAPVSGTQTVPAARPSPATQPAPATPPSPAPAGGVPKAQAPAPAIPAQGVPPKSAATPEDKVVSPAPERPVGDRPADTMPGRTPVLIAELPIEIQRDIPKLSILFHLYSGNPKDRLVGINDRMLREGDPVAPGLVLEQVTPDGMILSYKGYRFVHGTR